MEYQKTIKKEFRLTGPGLHTGRTVTVTVIPAPENFGIAFRRTDRTNMVTQPALADNVGETSRGTTLGSGRNSIATIEHLMSALTVRGELYRSLLPGLGSADPDIRRASADALRIGLLALDGKAFMQ